MLLSVLENYQMLKIFFKMHKFFIFLCVPVFRGCWWKYMNMTTLLLRHTLIYVTNHSATWHCILDAIIYLFFVSFINKHTIKITVQGPVPERCNNSIPGTNAPHLVIYPWNKVHLSLEQSHYTPQVLRTTLKVHWTGVKVNNTRCSIY